MKEVFGETRQLRPSDRTALEKLSKRRTAANEILDLDLAKRACQLAHKLGRQVGLIIGRDGRVVEVVLGGKDRIYLPDLGRFRVDAARLRGVRLVVFLPNAERFLQDYKPQELIFQSENKRNSKNRAHRRMIRDGLVRSPEIASDLLTDLEKLRLDAVVVLAAESDGQPGSMSLAYLYPGSAHPSEMPQSGGSRAIRFYHSSSLQDLPLDFQPFIEELDAAFTRNQAKGFDTASDYAVLVGAYTGRAEAAQSSMDELHELARTAGLEVRDSVMQRRRSLDPKTVIGKGKVEEVMLHCLDLGADLLIFDRELSPGQLRSITNLTELRVLDRSMLILDIFAQHAKSSEGKLQVELAQLKYSLPRLTEHDTGLSRLMGGVGGRGPGETKLEIGRRRVRTRIEDLERRIEKLASQRGLRRERRQNRGVPVIAIVGYTNAGKSTLLNALTKGNVLAASKLFATLDPSSRRMRFPNDKEVVFVDTVGFIRELPKELISAFRATLEEVAEADVLLHVVDVSNPEYEQQVEVVKKTLESLSLDSKPNLLIYNKVDRLNALERSTILRSGSALAVSATSREGFPELVVLLQKKLMESFEGQDPGRFTEVPSWQE